MPYFLKDALPEQVQAESS